MPAVRALLRSLYLTPRLFGVLGGCVVLFVLGHFVPAAASGARLLLLGTVALLALDLLLLYRTQAGVEGRREVPQRFSNGDANPVTLHLANRYAFPLHAEVLEELPVELQVRDARYRLRLAPGGTRQLRYDVHPVRRGHYAFGAVNVYAASPLGLAQRRYRFDDGQGVPVYPSFLQMRRYELLAVTHRLDEAGVKRVRRLGHTMEFDQIREYVVGDDHRSVNWKATARRGDLMVNQYRDERAQPVYCLLDMGRVMQLPFEEMTLLDYSINAALVLSNIALLKQDRAGLITFSHQIGTVVPAERRPGHLQRLQEALYRLHTDFAETDYERLFVYLRRTLARRSLLVLFTNFETRSALRRQLPHLRRLAAQHVVVVVFFENTELNALRTAEARTTEDVYVQTIAEQFAFEKREIVRTLQRYGIQAVLTPPASLTVETINAYLALKARGLF